MLHSKNHPRRAKAAPAGTPTPDEMKQLREAAGLTQEQAAALIWYGADQWAAWESGEKRMHPCAWWAFQQRLKEPGHAAR